MTDYQAVLRELQAVKQKLSSLEEQLDDIGDWSIQEEENDWLLLEKRDLERENKELKDFIERLTSKSWNTLSVWDVVFGRCRHD